MAHRVILAAYREQDQKRTGSKKWLYGWAAIYQ